MVLLLAMVCCVKYKSHTTHKAQYAYIHASADAAEFHSLSSTDTSEDDCFCAAGPMGDMSAPSACKS